MTAKERNSLALQIRYAYAVNRRSTHPVHVDVCGLVIGSMTRAHLENVDGFPDRWEERAFCCHEGDIEVVYSNYRRGAEAEEDDKGNDDAQSNFDAATGNGDDELASKDIANDDGNASNVHKSSERSLSLPPNHNFVYLTGDSPHLLTTLDDNTTYIIGGIVDRNRLKLAALHRADNINAQLPQLNVTTARLPLEEHLDFKGSTRVLTCNHVFEILQRYRENGYNDWRTSIMAVLPCRKDVEEIPKG